MSLLSQKGYLFYPILFALFITFSQPAAAVYYWFLRISETKEKIVTTLMGLVGTSQDQSKADLYHLGERLLPPREEKSDLSPVVVDEDEEAYLQNSSRLDNLATIDWEQAPRTAITLITPPPTFASSQTVDIQNIPGEFTGPELLMGVILPVAWLSLYFLADKNNHKGITYAPTFNAHRLLMHKLQSSSENPERSPNPCKLEQLLQNNTLGVMQEQQPGSQNSNVSTFLFQLSLLSGLNTKEKPSYFTNPKLDTHFYFSRSQKTVWAFVSHDSMVASGLMTGIFNSFRSSPIHPFNHFLLSSTRYNKLPAARK